MRANSVVKVRANVNPINLITYEVVKAATITINPLNPSIRINPLSPVAPPMNKNAYYVIDNSRSMLFGPYQTEEKATEIAKEVRIVPDMQLPIINNTLVVPEFKLLDKHRNYRKGDLDKVRQQNINVSREL